MQSVLSLFFATLLSFGHSQPAPKHHSTEFVPPAEFATENYVAAPEPARQPPARRAGSNYAEVACISCRMTNATSHAHSLTRAMR